MKHHSDWATRGFQAARAQGGKAAAKALWDSEEACVQSAVAHLAVPVFSLLAKR
jgi:hypothetical protein